MATELSVWRVKPGCVAVATISSPAQGASSTRRLEAALLTWSGLGSDEGQQHLPLGRRERGQQADQSGRFLTDCTGFCTDPS